MKLWKVINSCSDGTDYFISFALEIDEDELVFLENL